MKNHVYNKLFAFLLCLTLIVNYVPLSYAAEDIGLSVSTPSAGASSISFSWNNIPDAYCYAYSVSRLEPEEELVCDRVSTK